MRKSLHTLLILTVLALIGPQSITAQNALFSQIDFAPLTINPALTGLNNDLSVNLLSRGTHSANQKLLFRTHFTFDAAVNGRVKYRKGRFGLGLSYNNESGSTAALKSNQAQFNIAYNWFIRKWSTLGVGAYVGYGQNSFSPIAFDTLNQPYSVGDAQRNAVFDLGGGVVYTYKKGNTHMVSNNETSFDIGVSVYHITNPSYYFLEDLSFPYRMRYSFFTRGSVGVGRSMALMPALYYQYITLNRHDVLFGSYLKFTLNYGSRYTGYSKPSSLAFGIFYRYFDTLILSTLYNWSTFYLGLSFDLGITSFGPDNVMRLGGEVVFRYTIPSFYMRPIGGGRSGLSF